MAYALIAIIAVIALARVTGGAAYVTCVAIGGVYGGAALLAARGGPVYDRVRVPLTVTMRVAFVALHNLAIVLSEGPRRGQPDPSWHWFWTSAFGFLLFLSQNHTSSIQAPPHPSSTLSSLLSSSLSFPPPPPARTGPINVFILSAATGLPRGRALAAMLAGQAVAVAATQRLACAHLLRAYPLLAYFYSRLADVWGVVGRASVAAVLGGGWTGGVGAPVPPPPSPPTAGPATTTFLSPAAQAECATHACRFVMSLLYTGVGGLTWLLAPRPHGESGGGGRVRSTASTSTSTVRRSADVLDAALAGAMAAGAAALATWLGLVVLLPRPACCEGAAAAAAWETIQKA
jgi:hypothetical protein